MRLTQSSQFYGADRKDLHIGPAIRMGLCPFGEPDMAQLLIFACRSLPINNAPKSPWVLIEIELQFPILVDDQLSRRIQDSGTLALVLSVQVQLPCSQIETLRPTICPCFPEGDWPAGNKSNLSSGGCFNEPNEAQIVSQCTGDLYAAHRFHFEKGIR